MINVAIESYPYLKESKGNCYSILQVHIRVDILQYLFFHQSRCGQFHAGVGSGMSRQKLKLMLLIRKNQNANHVMNFGNEPDSTLLSSEEVAEVSLQTLLSDFTGQVIDIKLRKLITNL